MSKGKKIADHTYFHCSLLSFLSSEQQDSCNKSIELAKQHYSECNFNVFKIFESNKNITLLDYPDFFTEAFPQLARYWNINFDLGTVRYRTYENSLNPPILHRKELLLHEKHPDQEKFQLLTTVSEQIGLFDDPNRIGFKRSWESLLEKRGYRVIGHELLPIANVEVYPEESIQENFIGVARHLTALTRYNLSAPIQTLSRFNFLDGTKSIFDYGCGRGDDLRGLRENQLVADGWDPYYSPNEPKKSADLVNIGFVINVIEDINERIEALKGAYALTNELLVVSAMLANQEFPKEKYYGDGILTNRNTFQKYYTQAELRQFISEVLNEQPIPVGPGIYYIFKDKDAEQRFQLERTGSRRIIYRLNQLSRKDRLSPSIRANQKYEQHKDILEPLWEIYLSYGRTPDKNEIKDLELITQAFGSLKAALRFISSRKENSSELLKEAEQSRIDDLSVYFAKFQFGNRKRFKQLEPRLQKDIRYFFKTQQNAALSGRDLLFKAGKIEELGAACLEASERGIGWLKNYKSLHLHTSMIEQLSPVLRAYIYCGSEIYGDVTCMDIIKIHILTGKLTLIKFDDFTDSPLPKMIQRIKLNLRTQNFEIFDYTGQYPPTYLYHKSKLINEEFPNYAEQIIFEEALSNLGFMDFTGYGSSVAEFDYSLKKRRYEIDGLKLIRSKTIPNDIDAPCGRYLTYRNLIECGETQAKTKQDNLPKQADSFTALFDLASEVLDPIIEYFGMIKLTYGFCSPELSRKINSRIAPKLDQHAAHEINRLGRQVCKRLGAAVDFIIEDEDMLDVAKWIVDTNINFDRMYIYGPEKPIHISYGPEMKKQITIMSFNIKTQTLIPKVIQTELLNTINWQE
jgi:DNA phosphorothioation-associated putative methyltransferase